MNLILAAWRAFPAAPETRALKRLRLRSIAALSATGILVAYAHFLRLVHPFAVLLAPLAGIQAVIATGRYWYAKTRADEHYQASLGHSAAACDETPA